MDGVRSSVESDRTGVTDCKFVEPEQLSQSINAIQSTNAIATVPYSISN